MLTLRHYRCNITSTRQIMGELTYVSWLNCAVVEGDWAVQFDKVPVKHSSTLMNGVWGCWVIFPWQGVALGDVAVDFLCSTQTGESTIHGCSRVVKTLGWLCKCCRLTVRWGWPPGQLLTGQLVRTLVVPFAAHLTPGCSRGTLTAISVL